MYCGIMVVAGKELRNEREQKRLSQVIDQSSINIKGRYL
jgi:hypothetical protein